MKDYIGISDNQKNVLKVIKATKLLDEEIARVNKRLDKNFNNEGSNNDKKHIVMINNIDDIKALINQQDWLEVKKISILKRASSNFSKFVDNFWIIKRLYEIENRSIEFIDRWLRMSRSNLQLCIDRYFNYLSKHEEQSIKYKIKEERINKIKECIYEFLDINKRRLVTTFQMVDYINSNIFKRDDDKKTNYYEVYSCLRNSMKFGWRKASQRPPRWFQNWLEEARKVFKDFIDKLHEAEFVIVWIDISSFSSSALPLHSWMRRGCDAERVIIPSSQRFNVIAAQWNKEAYFMIKSRTTNEDQFWEF